VDVLILLTALSLMPLFAFMRNEFTRCRDAAVFQTVAQLGE
jgi:flagellar biosynthesis protein FliP